MHLPPSLGYAAFPGTSAALELLKRDLDALAQGGIDGVLLENDNDKPHTILVSKAQVAWLALACDCAKRMLDVPIGVGVQRMDAEATIAVAAACELEFVRLDVFVDTVIMQGEEVRGDPASVRALRTQLGAESTELWTDVHVKHAELLGREPIGDAAERAAREGSAAILVSGDRTGEPPRNDDLRAVKTALAGRARVVVGSGLTPENAASLAHVSDAAVVGTCLKTGDRIDPTKVDAMVKAWKRACASPA